jgi:hypothetical protein
MTFGNVDRLIGQVLTMAVNCGKMAYFDGRVYKAEFKEGKPDLAFFLPLLLIDEQANILLLVLQGG